MAWLIVPLSRRMVWRLGRFCVGKVRPVEHTPLGWRWIGPISTSVHCTRICGATVIGKLRAHPRGDSGSSCRSATRALGRRISGPPSSSSSTRTNAMPAPPAFVLHTGNTTRGQKPGAFDTVAEFPQGLKTGRDRVFLRPGKHDVLLDCRTEYFSRYGKGAVGGATDGDGVECRAATGGRASERSACEERVADRKHRFKCRTFRRSHGRISLPKVTIGSISLPGVHKNRPRRGRR
jgi:hypothetical protein